MDVKKSPRLAGLAGLALRQLSGHSFEDCPNSRD